MTGACDSTRPYCVTSGEDAGRCAACTRHDHCGPDGLCWFGACAARACTGNADCGDRATCVRSDDGERGGCVPAAQVLTVNSAEPCGGGDGRAQPYCDIQSALGEIRVRASDRIRALQAYEPALPPPLRVIRLLASGAPYEVGRIHNLLSPVYLIGDDDLSQTRLGVNPARDGVRVERGVQLTLQRVLIEDTLRGLVCEDTQQREDGRARVALAQVRVRNAREQALSLYGCDLAMDRVALLQSNGGALVLAGVSRYRITNSLFADNSSTVGPVVQLRGGSGRFRFNTLVNNRTPSGVALTCDQQPRALGASLILRSQSPESQSDLLVGSCELVDVVLDRPSSAPGAVVGHPQLVDPRPFGDYHLKASPETSACCLRPINRLRAEPSDGYSDPEHDFDGAPRSGGSQGLSSLGAYQVAAP